MLAMAENQSGAVLLDQNLVSWKMQRGPVTLAYSAHGVASDCTEQMVRLARASGVRLARVADGPGLVAQRVAAMLHQEAERVAGAGVATPDDIDIALESGLNFQAGPYTLFAQLGADVGARILAQLQAQDTSGRYRPD